MNTANELRDEIISACELAKGDALASAERLRRVRHAGRLAAALPRSKGGRNSSSVIDELARRVGISRQRLYAWIEAGRVDGFLASRNVDALDQNIKTWKNEIDVKRTVDLLFALADAEMKIRRIDKFVQEGR